MLSGEEHQGQDNGSYVRIHIGAGKQAKFLIWHVPVFVSALLKWRLHLSKLVVC